MVIVVKNREAVIDMIGTFKKFLKERQFNLNVEKLKYLIRKEKRKRKFENGRVKN